MFKLEIGSGVFIVVRLDHDILLKARNLDARPVGGYSRGRRRSH